MNSLKSGIAVGFGEKIKKQGFSFWSSRPNHPDTEERDVISVKMFIVKNY